MRYSPSLDGIRGIAVLTVVLSHFGVPFIQRGGFGVDIFFTLSGFLITSILLNEYARTNDISFRNFYLRRVLRLFPALLCLLLVYGTLVALSGGKNPTRHYIDICLVLLYVANWAGAAGLNRPGELGHTWSLSIEEQFYFIWPVLLFWLLKKWGRRGLLWGSILLTAASMAEMVVLAGARPWWRLYYGFDTRAFTLLFGCTLAIVLHYWEERARLPRTVEKLQPWVASIGIGASMFRTEGFLADPDFFRGNIFVIPFFTCCLLYTVAMPEPSFYKKFMSSKILIYFGKRSYGLYLWHYWIMNYWFMDLSGSKSVGARIVLAVVTLVASEVSYRLVEVPCMSLRKKFATQHDAPAGTLSEPAAALGS